MSAEKTVRVECQCCGHVLMLPEKFPENGRFTCGHCSLVMRNVEFTRAFRWAHVDPYVRKHGASRANLWGGLLGSILWLPLLTGVMAWQGELDIGLLLVVAAPYLLMLGVLRTLRARTPAALWGFYLWGALGGYFVYLRVLLFFFPGWAGVLLDTSVPSLSLWTLGGMGVTWMLLGIIGAIVYRRRARRPPVLTGAPPQV
ncbi:MAG: hypothetical protein ACYTG2_17840 [Planctomycetota bacterium]|jgi:hypothetical protein